MTITATEFKSNLGKYLDLVASGNEAIYITKNGREYAKLSSPIESPLSALNKLILLSDSINSSNIDIDAVKQERLEDKYGIRLD